MLMRPVSCLLLLVAAGAVVPRSAPGQARFELGPLLTAYTPLGSFEPAPYYSTALPNTPGDLGGIGWGGEGRVWLSHRAGIQLQFARTSSSVGGGNTPAGPAASTPASVLTISAQALYDLSPGTPGRVRLWLGAGAGVVRHGGTAYARYGNPAQVATALSFGSAFPLHGRLSAHLGVTTLFYYIDVSDSMGTSLEHGFQLDPLFHAGFDWGWP
jgi:hypothetical protein